MHDKYEATIIMSSYVLAIPGWQNEEHDLESDRDEEAPNWS